MTWLLVLLLISFPIGQLSRISILPNAQVYLHDLAIVGLWFVILRNYVYNRSRPHYRLLKPIAVFIVIAVISLILGTQKVQANQAFIGSLYLCRWVAYTGVYFATKQQAHQKKKSKNKNRILNPLELLLVAGLSFTAFGLIQIIFLPDLRELKLLGWDDHFGRLVGTLLDPGFSGIIITLTLMLTEAINLPKKEKWAYQLLGTIALLLTYSRASYLAFLSGIYALMIIRKKFKLALVITSLFLFSLPFLPQQKSEGTNLLRIYSVSQRLDTWKEAIAITKENPLFGVGLNLTRYAKDRFGFTQENWQTNHSAFGFENSYLFVLATTGIFGIIAFLNLLRSMASIGVEGVADRKQENSVLLASLIAVGVHALFTNTWFYPWVIIWIWYLVGVNESSYSS